MRDQLLVAVGKYGPSAVYTLLLILWLTVTLSAQIKELGVDHDALAHYLRAICENGAGDDVIKRNRCLYAEVHR
jgi:hypothetical protein